ncbi:MAG: hypothetical protein QM817_16300 [Archangium sp.]
MRARLFIVVLLVASACLPRIPRQRLSERAKIAVGYVVDPQYSGSAFAPPDALKDAIKKELDDHNLEIVDVPLETLTAQRLTDARFEALKKAAGEAPFLLLVEQRVQFFSQIDGRYRWEVGTALTASRAAGPVAKDPFEIPVILMFDHEKEREAIAYSANDVSNRVGVLLDGVLAGAEVAK